MIILACGSRDWDNQEIVRAALQELDESSVVVSGAARGADSIAADLAREMGLEVWEFAADWEAYGKRAGMMRNLQMLDQNPDQVWAFWDGQSRGTAHTVRAARKRGIQVRIWNFAGEEQTSLF